MTVMASLGHPESAVNIAISRYAPFVIGFLAAIILIVGVAAMAIDRRRTLKLRDATPPGNDAAPKAPPPDGRA